MGTEIEFEAGEFSGRGYLALPAGGTGPGILLIHAWWGLNEFFRATADRLAGEGYGVLAPDYYGGKLAGSIPEAQALARQVDRKQTNRLMLAAFDYLQAHPSASGTRLGVLGFSLGCGFALGLARTRPAQVAAVVLFYGTGGGRYTGLPVDFLGHFAEQDEWGAHPDKVQRLAERLGQANGEVIFHTYPGTRHWFFEQDQPQAFQPQAAELAWQRTLEFLSSHVRQAGKV